VNSRADLSLGAPSQLQRPTFAKGLTSTSGRYDHANFTGASLSEADLRFARAIGANFTGADLKGADLANSDFSEAVFKKTRFWARPPGRPNLPRKSVFSAVDHLLQGAGQEKAADEKESAEAHRRPRPTPRRKRASDRATVGEAGSGEAGLRTRRGRG
jgi:hypothetical protein